MWDWLHAVVWNQVVYLVRVVPKGQQFDAVSLSVGVAVSVLAGRWLIRRLLRA
jgi:hypothetical protein